MDWTSYPSQHDAWFGGEPDIDAPCEHGVPVMLYDCEQCERDDAQCEHAQPRDACEHCDVERRRHYPEERP